MRSLLPAILITGAAFSACNHQPIPNPLEATHLSPGYSDFASLPDYGWRYSDSVTFVTPAAEGELRVAVRHSISYPYRNLWLEVTRPGAGKGAEAVRDTVELELADPFGLWRGTGIGPTRQMEAVVSPKVKVDSGATITLRHIMRLDTLPAIEQTGIFIID